MHQRTPPASTLAAFLFMLLMAHRRPDHDRVGPHTTANDHHPRCLGRPSPTSIIDPSNWLLTLNAAALRRIPASIRPSLFRPKPYQPSRAQGRAPKMARLCLSHEREALTLLAANAGAPDTCDPSGKCWNLAGAAGNVVVSRLKIPSETVQQAAVIWSLTWGARNVYGWSFPVPWFNTATPP